MPWKGKKNNMMFKSRLINVNELIEKTKEEHSFPLL